MQFFQRTVRADQGPNAAATVIGLDLVQAVGHIVQCSLPIDGFPLSALFEHGCRQTVGAVQGFVREAVAVGNPAFVDGLIFERHHTHDLVVLDLHHQVGTGGIVRADGLAARQLPGAGTVAERLAGQGSNRANVDHVAGKFRVNRSAKEGFNLGMFTTV